MKKPTLYFVIDPLCGWTYAATPIFSKLLKVEDLDIRVQSGGMLAFNNTREISAQWRDKVKESDQRIEELTGMPFGKEYQSMMRKDGHVLNSEPASRAIMINERNHSCGLETLIRIQNAHFNHGRDISNVKTLVSIVSSDPVERNNFLKSYHSVSFADMHNHFKESSVLLRSVNGFSYPTAILHINEELTKLNLSQYYHLPDLWISRLKDYIERKAKYESKDFNRNININSGV